MNGDGPWLPDPRMIPTTTAHPRHGADSPTRSGGGQPSEVSAAAEMAADAFIRPFIVTGGRTQPLHDGLRVETLIYALPAALSAPVHFERRRIIEICQSPRSVAEIASALAMPLGVAKVLVGDLITSDLVSYQKAIDTPIHLIERILDRVRAL